MSTSRHRVPNRGAFQHVPHQGALQHVPHQGALRPVPLSRHATDVFQSLEHLDSSDSKKYVSFIYLTWCLSDVLIRAKDCDTLRPYVEAARWVPLSIHPFTSISSFLYAAIADDDDPTYFRHTPLFFFNLRFANLFFLGTIPMIDICVTRL